MEPRFFVACCRCRSAIRGISLRTNRGLSIVSPLSNVAQSVSPKSTPRWSSPVRARPQASSKTRSVTDPNHSPFLHGIVRPLSLEKLLRPRSKHLTSHLHPPHHTLA